MPNNGITATSYVMRNTFNQGLSICPIEARMRVAESGISGGCWRDAPSRTFGEYLESDGKTWRLQAEFQARRMKNK